MLHNLRIDIQIFKHLVVALKNLHGIPTLLLLGQSVNGCFLDMCKRMFNRAREGVHGNGFAVLCCIDCRFRSFRNAGSAQSGNFNDFAAKLTRKFGNIDFVAVLANKVDHVDCNNNRNTKLRKLSCKIQVALQIRAVDDVQYRIGTLADKVVARNDLFKGVW